MTKQYRTEKPAVAHETAQGLFDAYLLPKHTMKEFDEACLAPIKKTNAKEFRELRKRESASKKAFARYLNVTPGLVSQWERGEKNPGARRSSS